MTSLAGILDQHTAVIASDSHFSRASEADDDSKTNNASVLRFLMYEILTADCVEMAACATKMRTTLAVFVAAEDIALLDCRTLVAADVTEADADIAPLDCRTLVAADVTEADADIVAADD